MKYVLWLNNGYDRQDDEWTGIIADSYREAEKIAYKVVDYYRNFSIGHIYTEKEFIKRYHKNYLKAISWWTKKKDGDIIEK